MPRKSNAAGVYSSTPITLSEGDEADLQLTSTGAVKTVDSILASVYDSSTGTLRIKSTNSSEYFAKNPFYANDFLTQTLSQHAPFTSFNIASGTLAAPNTVTAEHPGVARIRSSTTPNSGIFIGTNSGMLILGGDEKYDAIFNVSTLALSTIRMGFLDTSTHADATDGCYLEIDSTGVATGKTADNGTRSNTASTTTLSTATWYRLNISLNSDATSVSFTIYDDAGTVVWTDSLTTNIPTASGRTTGAAIVGTNSGTTALDICELDYMSISFSGLVR